MGCLGELRLDKSLGALAGRRHSARHWELSDQEKQPLLLENL